MANKTTHVSDLFFRIIIEFVVVDCIENNTHIIYIYILANFRDIVGQSSIFGRFSGFSSKWRLKLGYFRCRFSPQIDRISRPRLY